MRAFIQRKLQQYGAIIAMVPKLYMAYSIWVWMEFFVQLLSMIIFVSFWRAIYASQTIIAGLDLSQTLNYILLVRILVPVISTRSVFNMGFLVREGAISIELLRPIDFQERNYIESLAGMVLALVLKLPLVLFAWVAFGLTLPSEPATWAAFLVTFFMGFSIIAFFDWAFASLAFYSTETWGLAVVREAVALFFSGSLLPLDMLPDWLRAWADALPFAQAIYVPVSILSGITPPSAILQIFTVQLAWLMGMLVFSRLVFKVAVRKVTVQGG